LVVILSKATLRSEEPALSCMANGLGDRANRGPGTPVVGVMT